MRAGKWVKPIPAKRRLVAKRGDAGSTADGCGRQEQFGRERSSSGSSIVSCSEVERVSEKRGTWKRVKREEIGRKRSKLRKKGRQCIEAVRERRKPCVFPELSIATQVVPQ